MTNCSLPYRLSGYLICVVVLYYCVMHRCTLYSGNNPGISLGEEPTMWHCWTVYKKKAKKNGRNWETKLFSLPKEGLSPKSAFPVAEVYEMGLELIPYPPYSPDLAPCNISLFSNVKKIKVYRWELWTRLPSTLEMTILQNFDNLLFSKAEKKLKPAGPSAQSAMKIMSWN